MKLDPSLELKIIPTVLQFFSIGQSIETTPIKEGISNHNYIVKTADNEYVVKFLVTQNIKTIENDVAIQLQLKHNGVHTPEYILGDDGTYIFNSESYKAVVSEKVGGVVPRIVDLTLAKEFGQKLALFHTSVIKIPHENNKGLMNPTVSRIKSNIYSLELPQGIIHGDFHLGNVLVDIKNQNHIVAILDYEESGKNLYIVDLALTVMGVCFSAGEVSMDVNLIKALIKGYESVRKLTPKERQSFSEAIRYTSTAWINWFKENNYEKYAEKHQSRFNSFLTLNQESIFN